MAGRHVSSAWSREDDPGVAANKILDAAGKAFAEIGVSAAGMTKIAGFAGCSRGTLYRYYPTRHALHVAFINRQAVEIAERVRAGLARIDDPRERVVEAIVRSVREVRRNPATAAWFEPGIAGAAARMSRSSEVIDALGDGFVAKLLDARSADADGRLRARWVMRTIVSLLVMPGASEAEERELVERFVVPGLGID